MTTCLDRQSRIRLVALIMGALLAVPVAEASHGCRIQSAADVMATRVHASADGLDFTDVEGKDWSLVTSTSDPAISYSGSGSFHPASTDIIRSAVGQITWPGMNGFDADIIVLPYPRRDLLPSSAAAGAVYLSPGVHPWPEAPLHALVVHELGHVVHERYMGDDTSDAWRRYRQIRGLNDTSVYRDGAAHRNRPHEIFAEDFRALFGGAEANYSNSVENTELPPPHQVPGLYEFMASLAGASSVGAPLPVDLSLVAAPNPFSGTTWLAVGLPAAPGGPISIEIFDALGRLVVNLGAVEAGTDKMGWNGRDNAGRVSAAGVYYARAGNRATFVTTRVVLTR